ncbi:helix-turn-helix domain-containing protein [Dyella sp. ASV21]|uniref:helix-turn-helix domain-containing protein n=1 Tax=Dyella sp. ASV21 TaxID=2795114 RepID=UPI0018ED8247|nr:helix-turn-helix domain-containing protein [Dyella sp. ASV21]
MTTYAHTIPNASAVADTLSILQRLRPHCSSIAAAVVLLTLAQTTEFAEGECTTALSTYEIANSASMTPAAVQRAINSLRDAGLIARHQHIKQKGCVALTLITPKGLDILRPSALGATSLPASLLSDLVGEPLIITEACAQAWKEGVVPDPSLLQDFRGPSDAYERVMGALRANTEQAQETLMAAVDEAQLIADAEAEGRVVVPLSDGTVLELNAAEFAVQAPCPVDLRFIRETLLLVMARGRQLNGPMAKRLAAEAGYSRAVGFVRGHAWDAGSRVLASVMSRVTWSRPRSIRQAWYTAVESCSAVHGGQLSTGASVSVH